MDPGCGRLGCSSLLRPVYYQNWGRVIRELGSFPRAEHACGLSAGSLIPQNNDVINRFRYYLRVRYGECDAQRVVFNARYGDYVDLATTEFLRALGFGDDVIQGTLDYQLVKQTFEWKQPACFDQVLEVAVAATRLGNTSFTLHSEFRIAGDERPIAGVETVYVLVDSVTLQKRELPPDFRAALERGAPNQATDHANYLGQPVKRDEPT